MSSSSIGMSSSSEESLLDTYINHIQDRVEGIVIERAVIALATNNFADENLLSHSLFAKPYKGQIHHLGHLINIVAWKYTQKGYAFNELIRSRILKHKNILSVFKVYAEIDGTINLVNKHEANESLDKHLSGSTLTWKQRLHICVGVAQALSYLHNDVIGDHNVIHGNIKSSKILLDDNWEPKLYDFGFSIIAKRNVLYHPGKYNGTSQYMDPAYEETRGLTPRSDVFSFGVVLFEVLFGRKASSPIPEEDNWNFAGLARLHYERKTLNDMIDPELQKQMEFQSLLIFSETAYCCLKEERSQRPNMDLIVRRLEAALKHQQNHEDPEPSMELSTAAVEATWPNHWKEKLEEIEKLKETQQVLKLCSNMDVGQQSPIDDTKIFKRSEDDDETKLFFVHEVNGKKCIMASAKIVVYDSSNVKPFDYLIQSAESRFQEVVELLRQQVFGIECCHQIQITLVSLYSSFQKNVTGCIRW